MSSALLDKFTCPECSTVLKLGNPVAPGKKVKCPKCSAVFAAQAETPTLTADAQEPTLEMPPPMQPIAAAAKRTTVGRPGPAAKKTALTLQKQPVEPMPLDDPDEEPRPRRKSGSKGAEGNPLLLWGSIGGGTFAVLLIGFLVYWFAIRDSKTSGTEVASATEKEKEKEKEPEKPAGEKLRSSAPATKPVTPKPPSNPSTPPPPSTPVANVEFADPLNFLPIETQLVMGIDAAFLSEEKWAEMLGAANPLLQGNGNALNDVNAKFGLQLQDIASIVVGMTDLKNASKDLKPKMVLVIRTKQPYDSAKVLQALEAGSPGRTQGKDIYKTSKTDIPGTIYLPSKRHIVLAELNPMEISRLLALDGQRCFLSADLQTMMKYTSGSLAHVSISMDVIRANMPPGVMDSGLQKAPVSIQVLARQALQGRAATLYLRKNSDRLELTVSMLCDTPTGAIALKSSLDTVWQEYKPTLAQSVGQAGPGQAIAEELLNNLTISRDDRLVSLKDEVKIATVSSSLGTLLAQGPATPPKPPVIQPNPPVVPPPINPPPIRPVPVDPKPNDPKPPVDPNPPTVDPKPPVDPQNDPALANLKKLFAAYYFFVGQVQRAPRSADELKAFVAAVKMQNPQIESQIGNPDEFLLSPNDMQPFVVHWGIFPAQYSAPPSGPVVFAYEKIGKDGRRAVVLTNNKPEYYTDAQLQKAKFPRNFKAPASGAVVPPPPPGVAPGVPGIQPPAIPPVAPEVKPAVPQPAPPAAAVSAEAYETIIRVTVQNMKTTTSLIRSAVNDVSAREVAPRIRAQADQLQQLKQQLAALGPASPEVRERHRQQQDAELKAAAPGLADAANAVLTHIQSGQLPQASGQEVISASQIYAKALNEIAQTVQETLGLNQPGHGAVAPPQPVRPLPPEVKPAVPPARPG